VSLGRRKRWIVLERDNFTCRYCGRSAPDVVLQVDHVTARAMGGKDNPENLVTACFDCNQGKKTMDAGEALQFMDWYREARQDADAMWDEALILHDKARGLDRAMQTLVYELAYRTGMTEGDVWDWLHEELAG
jgi:hypothetical protein